MTTPSQFPYTKLPGALRGFVRKASLWEGPDHLLSVTGTRFAEDYRRFYYRDIEAILLQKCVRAGSVGLWVAGVLACLIAITIGTARSTGGRIAGLIAVVVALTLVYRLVISLRYSCRCYIQTAVSREELPSLLRTWTAQKTLDRLRTKIVEAQGLLPENLSDLPMPANAAAPPMDPKESAANTDANQKSASRGLSLALAAFVLLLVDAAVSFRYLDAPARAVNAIWIFSIALIVVEGAAAVLALLNLSKLRPLRPLRYLLFGTLAFLSVEIWFSLYFPQLSGDLATLHIANASNRIWHWVQLVTAILALLLGSGGLTLVLLKWQTYRRGPVSTA
jgi:hypothetical protein